MEIFYYFKHLPEFLAKPGMYYPFDLVCMCEVPNFFGVVLHLLIIGLLVNMLLKNKELKNDNFFMMLGLGLVFSAISKILDWYMNARTGIEAAQGVYFNLYIDITLAFLQLIGTAIIFYAIITKLFYVHHERSTSS